MSSTTYCAWDNKDWAAAGLKDYEGFSDYVTYRNERESGYGDLEGEWYYGDDDTLTIYFGTHGNDHSPGANSYTYARVYDDNDEYRAAMTIWEACPEYLDE